METVWIFLGYFWDFWGIYLGFFLGVIFLEDFFWEDFFGGIFWEDFLGKNYLFKLLMSAKLFDSERDSCLCQDFVSMENEGKS